MTEIEEAWDNCRKVILEDEHLRAVDSQFYCLLEQIDGDIRTELEEAYLEYSARAIELAYRQGVRHGTGLVRFDGAAE